MIGYKYMRPSYDFFHLTKCRESWLRPSKRDRETKGKDDAVRAREKRRSDFCSTYTSARASAVARRASSESVCAPLNLGRQVDGTDDRRRKAAEMLRFFACAICIARPESARAPIDQIAGASAVLIALFATDDK